MFSYKAQEELELMGFAKLECSNAGLRPEEKLDYWIRRNPYLIT